MVTGFFSVLFFTKMCINPPRGTRCQHSCSSCNSITRLDQITATDKSTAWTNQLMGFFLSTFRNKTTNTTLEAIRRTCVIFLRHRCRCSIEHFTKEKRSHKRAFIFLFFWCFLQYFTISVLLTVQYCLG